MTYNLSKSRYCSGVQCPKMLWLKNTFADVNSISAVGIIIMELMKWHSSAIASWLTVL